METTKYVPIKEDVKKIHVYKVVVVRDEDEYHADIPALPGCYGRGETYEEALKSAKDAAQLWLEDMREAGEVIPEDTQTTLKRAPITIGVVL
jgi:antitoxin HicB